MELSDYLRDPMSAALIAGGITAAIHSPQKQLSIMKVSWNLNKYTKPAVLNAILVFFIVSNGLGKKEAISM
jgi:hypothetical protein